MVDSLTFSKELKDVAECFRCLYNLLTDKVISSNRTPIVVACNKQDITMAKGSKVIKSQLEKEMNKVRVSRSAALQGQDNSSNSVVFLGKKNKEFEFSDLKGLKVEFVECSCKGLEDSDGDLKELYEWIEKIA
ncbi:unnamed protein product [Owenia fusiformis]|uniref:Signal recognition particle receptor subunit beta n=1 Tax=Owenia fusiformis TaxID=6347 RepID=A0A8S4N565_OWEFU|nr:unnamed protein product [Owenia fusiformis]